MRLFLAPILIFTLGTCAAFAQTIPEPPSTSVSSLTKLLLLPSQAASAGVSPLRQPPAPQSKQKEHESAVADCMRTWDAGTHMSKQEWARTCKRVQSRLDNLKLDGLIPDKKSKLR